MFIETIYFHGIALPTGCRARIFVGFRINQSGELVEIPGSQLGIKFLTMGELSWEYEPEEFWMIPGIMDFEFHDSERELWKRFFENQYYDKRPEITLLIETSPGSNTYETKHKGRVVYDTVTFNESTRIIKMTAAGSTDMLNEVLLYNDDGSARNPLGYTPPPANYPRGGHHWKPLRTMVHDIFKVINPGIELEFSVHKEYSGIKYINSAGVPTTVERVAAEDINVLTYYFFFNRNSGLTTLADVLKELAFSFGCVAGLISNDRAFFRQFFTSGAETIPIDTKLKDGDTLQDWYPKKYVLINEGVVDGASNAHVIDPFPYQAPTNFDGSRYLAAGSPPSFATPALEAKSGINEENLTRSMVRCCYYREYIPDRTIKYFYSDFFYFPDRETDEYGYFVDWGNFSYGDQFAIHRAHRGSAQLLLAEDLSITWYELMRELRHTQYVKLNGCEFDYVKNFSLRGKVYQPVRMSIDFLKNQTKIEGLRI